MLMTDNIEASRSMLGGSNPNTTTLQVSSLAQKGTGGSGEEQEGSPRQSGKDNF